MSVRRASMPSSGHAPTIACVARSVVGVFVRYAWLWFALSCILLAYLTIWQRGSLTDDYTHRVWLIDPISGRWAPPWGAEWARALPMRALTIVTVTIYSGLLSTHELAVRLLAAFLVGLNALLLGLLVWRLLRARAPAIISGWLFAVPLYAHEAVLWASAAGYVLAATLALGFLHACLSALRRPRAAWRWGLLGAVLFGLMLLFVEQFALAAALVPLLAVASVPNPAGRRLYGRALGGAALLLALPAALSLLAYRALYVGSWVVATRGGLDPSPAGIWQRTVEYTMRVGRITAWPTWGGQLTREALVLELDTLVGSGTAAALVAAALASFAVTLVYWPRPGDRRPAGPTRRACAAPGLWCVGLGLTWTLLPIYLPGVVVRGQHIEYRMLYFPLAGVASVAGALSWLALRTAARPTRERALLAAAGVVAVASSLAMLGYAGAYAARGAHDAQQLEAFAAAVPDDLLPEGVYIVPVDTDEHHLAAYPTLGSLLPGVFETPWSTAGALSEAYGRTGLSSITGNRWLPLTIAEEDAAHLRAQGTVIPVDRALLFSYRDGGFYVYEALAMTRPGGTTHEIALPLGVAAAREGTPTIAVYRAQAPS